MAEFNTATNRPRSWLRRKAGNIWYEIRMTPYRLYWLWNGWI